MSKLLTLLKTLYLSTEELKGKRLAVVLLLSFVVCFGIGFGFNYVINTRLNNYENSSGTAADTYSRIAPEATTTSEMISKQGFVTFIDPKIYPGENISFYLADASGKQLILLTADDQKLEVAEGMSVIVEGTLEKTKTLADVLKVQRIIVKN